jgi:hypothetical protein
MAFAFALLVALIGQPHPAQLHVAPHVFIQSASELYKAGTAAASAKQWDVAAERFRDAIARDGKERPGYFPHYWLGVAYDELHETAKAFAEWKESQRQGAIAGTGEEATMKRRMLAHMHTAARPPHGIDVLPMPPPPQPQPVPQPQVILSHTAPTETTATTVTETAAMTTATTGTTTTEHHHDPTTPDGQLFNEIDERFKALNPGELVISAPKEMRVAVPERFVLRIAAANQTDGITSDLSTSAQTATSTVHVTPIMRATLDGAGFTIQSTSKEEQVIGGGSYTEWSWLVTPTASGDRELVATVYAELDANRVKGFPKRWPVRVRANAGRSFSQFFGSNWQWLSSTLLIPLFLFFWQQRKKTARRKSARHDRR